ncbi:MAG: hypothetical protein H5T41_00695 [Methanomassiliicoccales archaeon]|nr:hypothetical protein [Methanomassiliicoccales archaeon]
MKHKKDDNNINGTSVSKNESFLLSKINEKELLVFGVGEAISLTGWSRDRVCNTLASLERKGIIARVRRNAYALSNDLPKNIFAVATEAIKPSYISFWTALSYYGFTEQQVMVVQLVSTRQFRPFYAAPFRCEVVKFKISKFFGYRKIDRFVIAEKEKALIDSLSRLDLCGGLSEYAKSLKNAWPSLDKKKFAEYLIKFGNKSVISRIGFLTEHMGLSFPEADRLLPYRSSSFTSLDPRATRTNCYNNKWHIIINAEIGREGSE